MNLNICFLFLTAFLLFSIQISLAKPPLKDTSEKHLRVLERKREKYQLGKTLKSENYARRLVQMKGNYAKNKRMFPEKYNTMLQNSKIRSSEGRLFKKYGKKMPGGKYDHDKYAGLMKLRDKHAKRQNEFQTAANLMGTIHTGLSDVIGSKADVHRAEIGKLEKEMDDVYKAGPRPLYSFDDEN